MSDLVAVYEFVRPVQPSETFDSMNRRPVDSLLGIAIIAASALSAGQFVIADEPAKSLQRLVVTADELRSAKIIGDLGLPLGTLMLIEGTYQYIPDNPRTKTNEEALVLNIFLVNGVKLNHPICTYNHGPPWVSAKGRKQLDGQPFKLRGYELGCIRGDVKEAQAYEPIVAKTWTPFGLTLDFAVVYDEARKLSLKDVYDKPSVD